MQNRNLLEIDHGGLRNVFNGRKITVEKIKDNCVFDWEPKVQWIKSLSPLREPYEYR